MRNFQNFQHFKEFVEIDYFTYFTKCYFAFNAYIKAKFQGNDREKIDSLKENTTIQSRFKELLDKDTFCSNLKDFKQKLYETQIKNENVIISFERVRIQSFKEKQILNNEQPIKYHNTTYILKILPGKDERVSFQCKNKNGEEIAKEECKYSKLTECLNKTKLSKFQRDKINSCFDEEIKNYNKDLTNEINNIEQKKDTDYELIYKGFIEIIYQLRNALFHSEIDPKQENILKVYKLAYLLFKDFISNLPIEDTQ